MPGVLTRTPSSGFQVGPDPSGGLGFIDIFKRFFIVIQDLTFAVGIIAIVLGSVYFFYSKRRRRAIRFIYHGSLLTGFLFFFGSFLNLMSWIMTGSTRFDESVALITDSISFPASILRRSIVPPGPIPTPAASSSYPVHVLGRLLSLEVLFLSFLGLMGLTIGVVMKFTPGHNERGHQWARSGVIVTACSFVIHAILSTLAWLAKGTTGFGSGKIVSLSYANQSKSTIQYPDHLLINNDLIYPLAPTEGKIWPVIHALERSLQVSITTVAWIGLIGVVAGAAIYFGSIRETDRGQQWIVGGVTIIIIMLSIPLIVSTGTWIITGETQALTEFGGGPLTTGSTFESQTAEGWTATDGGLAVVATNETRDTFGLRVVGSAKYEYDVEDDIDSEHNISILIARGQGDVSVSADGVSHAHGTDVTGQENFVVPDGDRLTITVDGIDVVIEEVVIRKESDIPTT